MIDCGVFDKQNNVALSKDDFAKYILNQEEGFNKFKFTEFGEIFEVIQLICESVEDTR